MSDIKSKLVAEVKKRGLPNVLKRQQIVEICREKGWSDGIPEYLLEPGHKVGFGVYNVDPSDDEAKTNITAAATAATRGGAHKNLGKMTDAVREQINEAREEGDKLVVVSMHDVSYIPDKKREFVPTKDYATVRDIIKSRVFFPTYLTGLSGMGKTENIVQAAANCRRELVRLNFTEETGERHIVGGWRLESGNTIWEDGPALIAMKRGAVLLLDEVDFSSPKVLCLQSILEGSSYINKQTGEIVKPQPGFTIFATGNTKGTVSGRNARFVGARAQNEAFMDRFEITIEMDYVKRDVEAKILSNFWTMDIGQPMDDTVEKFITTLVMWAEVIRSGYEKGTCQDVISTRRLRSALKSYYIFRRMDKALNQILQRFSTETQEAFMNFYKTLAKIPLESALPDEVVTL